MENLQSVQQVDRYVHQRRYTDQRLISWLLYFFLLSWITFGIYVVYVFYLRLSRADRFRDRRLNYYTAVLEATQQELDARHRSTDFRDDLDDLGRYVQERFADEHRPIQPGLTVFLSIITLGIYGLFAIYRMMRFWWEIQLTEQDFDEKLSLIWTQSGMVAYPITFEPDEEVHRSFGVHLLLSVVTFGIFGIVWDYRLHTDPDRVFPEFHSAEDAVLATFRSTQSSSRSNNRPAA